MIRRIVLAFLVVPAFLVVLTACSDDGGGDGGATSTTGEEAATTTAGPGEAALPCDDPDRPEGSMVEISAVDFRFQPDCLELGVDQGINVTNEGAVLHNVTLEVVGGPESELLGGDIQPGENTATEAFGNEGPGADVYRLYCKYHESRGMEAYLRVG